MNPVPASDPAATSAAPAAWYRRARVLGQDWTETEGRRWLFVMKTMLAAFLALWIAFRLGFDSPRSAMMTVFIVALPSSGMALEKSIYRMIGTLVGCAAALSVIALFAQQPVLLFIALALWIAFCTGGSAWMRNARSYGFVLAGYTACMIALPAIDTPLDIFNLAVARVTEISLGIMCAALVNDALFPAHQSEQLVDAVRKLYRNFADLCHDAMQGRLGEDRLERLHLQFATEVAALESWRAAAFFEAGDMRVRNQQLHAFNAAAMVGLTTFHTLHQLLQRLRNRAEMRVPELMRPLLDAFSRTLLVTDLPARTAAEAGITLARFEELQQALPHMITTVRSEALQLPLDSRQKLNLDSALELIQRFSAEFHELVAIYHDLPRHLSDTSPKSGGRTPSYSPKAPLMIAVAAGARAAAALLLLSLAWYGLNWPSASGAVIITVVFCGLAASSPDPVGLIRQTTLGFIIATPFAFFCAFFMLNHVEGYLMLVLSMLPFLMTGAYLSSWRKVAGIGFGFNIMFAQMIAPENLMRFNAASFINDSMAQIIGLLLATLMFALILPEHRQGSRRHIAEALWNEVLQLCSSDMPHLRHHFENRIRDLLNQLSIGIRGTADGATRQTLNQAVALLELGHAVIDLRDLSTGLKSGHPLRAARANCIAALSAYFRQRHAVSHEQAVAAMQSNGERLQALLADPANLPPGEAAHLQRALTDIHLIHASLLDPSLHEAPDESTLPNGASHAA